MKLSEQVRAGDYPVWADKIAELEAELEAVKHDKEGWYNADGYAEIVKRLEAELAHANIESVDLENENQRLREALPPPGRLRILADWFDCNHWSPDTEVQDDLRRWADAIDQALEKEI